MLKTERWWRWSDTTTRTLFKWASQRKFSFEFPSPLFNHSITLRQSLWSYSFRLSSWGWRWWWWCWYHFSFALHRLPHDIPVIRDEKRKRESKSSFFLTFITPERILSSPPLNISWDLWEIRSSLFSSGPSCFSSSLHPLLRIRRWFRCIDLMTWRTSRLNVDRKSTFIIAFLLLLIIRLESDPCDNRKDTNWSNIFEIDSLSNNDNDPMPDAQTHSSSDLSSSQPSEDEVVIVTPPDVDFTPGLSPHRRNWWH